MTICRSEQGRKVGLLNVCPDLPTVTRTGQQLLDEAVDLVVRYNDLCLVASLGGDGDRFQMPLTGVNPKIETRKIRDTFH